MKNKNTKKLDKDLELEEVLEKMGYLIAENVLFNVRKDRATEQDIKDYIFKRGK